MDINPQIYRATPSPKFTAWLAAQKVSIAITTYLSEKLIFLGVQPSGDLLTFDAAFNRAMGMWSDGQTIWLTTYFQLWKLVNCLKPGVRHAGRDALYIPQIVYTTGHIDTHDVAIGEDGPVFVNTLYNCLAKLSDTNSFRPFWRPPFISGMVAEDRCHLNGLAMEDGRPRYVTAVAESDTKDGWRGHRNDGGIVMDILSNKIVGRGFSMPHSPRIYNGRLWMHDSGNGKFGSLDPATGAFTPLCFCPGYLRGLCFSGNYAIVGLSGPRGVDNTFGGLPLDVAMRRSGQQSKCGIRVVNLETGAIEHGVDFDGCVSELYDVVTLPNVERPMTLNAGTTDIHWMISIEE